MSQFLMSIPDISILVVPPFLVINGQSLNIPSYPSDLPKMHNHVCRYKNILVDSPWTCRTPLILNFDLLSFGAVVEL